MKWWKNDRTVDDERTQLAQKQFDFYAGELKDENPFSSVNDGAAVAHARTYLSQFAGVDRVYAFMLSEAGEEQSAHRLQSPVRGLRQNRGGAARGAGRLFEGRLGIS